MHCGCHLDINMSTPIPPPTSHKDSLDTHSEIPTEGPQLPARSSLSQPRKQFCLTLCQP